jgi:signal transduction histidine kinase
MTAEVGVATFASMPLTLSLPALARRRPSPLVVDAGLAAVVALVTGVAVAVQAQNEEPMQAIGYPLLVVQLVPLVWRRRAPIVVAIVVGVAAAVYGIAELPDPPIMFAPLLAWYSAAAYRPRRVTVPLALTAVVVGLVSMALARDSDAADVAVNLFAGAMAFVVGYATRGERQRAQLLVERREDAERQAVAEERVRIARDLHDVVAHHLSVIAVQTEAAQSVLATEPARAEKAMARVGDTARVALGELRRMLGALRTDPSLVPQPDLAAVGNLADTVRQTGLAVTVHVDDRAAGVGGLVGVAGYRVVQEALTNVIKHADARHVEVTLAVDGDDLRVTVSDDGRGAGGSARPTDAHRAPGLGLAGMRERVRVLGGDLTTGPGPTGGFTVQARLPLEG